MVLVGKEDTLLQLAKTDREKSGKQLLALLTLEDSFATVKARKSLQKNAFALMKLRRYKDAAAVFLLAVPPFIKEACSVLQTQHDDPLFALLVTRLAEHRSAVSKLNASASPPKGVLGANIETTTASTIAVYNKGYLLGPVARTLLQNCVLPSLLTCSRRSSLRAIQSQTQAQAVAAATTSSGVTAAAAAGHSGYSGAGVGAFAPSDAFAHIAGVDALAQGLVAATWLQDADTLEEAFRELLGRYSLVDCCRVASTSDDGELFERFITALDVFCRLIYCFIFYFLFFVVVQMMCCLPKF